MEDNYFDNVLLYKNEDSLIEAVYKSENPELFNKLLSQEHRITSFPLNNLELTKTGIDLLLWKINLDNRELPREITLECVADPLALGDKYL